MRVVKVVTGDACLFPWFYFVLRSVACVHTAIAVLCVWAVIAGILHFSTVHAIVFLELC